MHRAILIILAQNLFELPCLTGRKGRDGTFPASACIKLTGTYVDTGEVGRLILELVVRHLGSYIGSNFDSFLSR